MGPMFLLSSQLLADRMDVSPRGAPLHPATSADTTQTSYQWTPVQIPNPKQGE